MNNWIDKHYPAGQVISIPDLRTGDLADAVVVNHLQGAGFAAKNTVGVTARFEDGGYQVVSAAFLDEDGGDRVEHG